MRTVIDAIGFIVGLVLACGIVASPFILCCLVDKYSCRLADFEEKWSFEEKWRN